MSLFGAAVLLPVNLRTSTFRIETKCAVGQHAANAETDGKDNELDDFHSFPRLMPAMHS